MSWATLTDNWIQVPLPLVVCVCALHWNTVRPACGEQALSQTVETGPVQVTLTLEPETPLIGDVVTLTIEVTSEKGVEVLMPEFGEALERFSIVDFVPRETLDDEGRTVATQQYRLYPPSSGPQAIPPILIEYVDRRAGKQTAPDGLDAYELLTERLDFTVQSVLPADATADLQPPLGELAPRAAAASSRWPWLLAAVVGLAIAGPLLTRAYWSWRRQTRRQSAYEIARSRLDRLLACHRPEAEQLDAFYVELSGIVRRYLEDRFELRAPELTTEEFLIAVGTSPDLSSGHQTLLREFLREADLVKFARARPSSDDIAQSVDAARRFLEETRENSPLMDIQQTNPAA